MKSFFKFLFVVFGLFSFYISNAQVVTPPAPERTIEIVSGLSLREKTIDSLNKIETIAGNVLLREGLTKFYCDSAIINRQDNTIEAFGNVHINDDDSLHTYSQYLKYFGDSRLAYLKKKVKLTDSKGTLLTENLEYDLAAGIGKYNDGGKVLNGTTVLTSNNGIYYADTKDVYFKNNVDLKDPKYKIKADSLLYNTTTQVVTLIGPTHITSREANIFTTEGTYDLKTGNAFFGTRSLITDSSGRIYQADKIAIDEKAGFAELDGSAIIRDTANGVIVTGNHIYLNNRNNSFLATNKPVMIIQQENDSIYIAADTLFSGYTAYQDDSVKITKTDSADIAGSVKNRNKNFKKSRVVIEPGEGILTPPENISTGDSLTAKVVPLPDSMVLSKDTPVIKPELPIAQRRGSRKKKNKKYKRSFAREEMISDTTALAKTNQQIDSITVKALPRPDYTLLLKDTSFLNPDTLLTQTPVKKLLMQDTIAGTKVISANKADSTIRYFLAFHHVRIFNDSMQSVCDSLIYSAQDSTFRLFQNPIVWNGDSQVTGDTIFLYTKNKKPERFYVFEKGMVVNKSNKQFYNQIAGKTINGYFVNGAIDYVRVKGQKAESIYYVQDKDSAYVGMNRATGDVIDMYFLKNELNKVKFVNDVHGVMHPIRQIPDDQKFLNGFIWEDKRRPKNKLELFE
jgi:lipopolysaccharide export system protein LptA